MNDPHFPLTATEGYKTLNYEITTVSVGFHMEDANPYASQSYTCSLRTSMEREVATRLTRVVADLFLGKRYSGETRRGPMEMVRQEVAITVRRRRWFYHLWELLPQGRFAQGAPCPGWTGTTTRTTGCGRTAWRPTTSRSP